MTLVLLAIASEALGHAMVPLQASTPASNVGAIHGTTFGTWYVDGTRNVGGEEYSFLGVSSFGQQLRSHVDKCRERQASLLRNHSWTESWREELRQRRPANASADRAYISAAAQREAAASCGWPYNMSLERRHASPLWRC